MRSLIKSREFTIFLSLVVLMGVIASKSDQFLTAENLLDILKGNSVLGILAFGMTLIILTGGIDVSVGSVLTGVAVVLGKFMVTWGGNLVSVFLVAIAAGISVGALHGLLVAKARIPAIVVTLGTMSIINGVTLIYTRGRWVDNLPRWFLKFGLSKVLGGIPVQVMILLAMAALSWFILRYTLVGRSVYAVGGNPVSAVRIGISLERTLMFVYLYMGFVTGVAGVVHASIIQQIDPNAASGLELQVIAAVVVGGANITGGTGSILGTLLGVVFLATINNGLILARIPTFWQKIAVGLIIVLAVSFDVLQKKRAERRLVRVDVE